MWNCLSWHLSNFPRPGFTKEWKYFWVSNWNETKRIGRTKKRLRYLSYASFLKWLKYDINDKCIVILDFPPKATVVYMKSLEAELTWWRGWITLLSDTLAMNTRHNGIKYTNIQIYINFENIFPTFSHTQHRGEILRGWKKFHWIYIINAFDKREGTHYSTNSKDSISGHLIFE